MGKMYANLPSVEDVFEIQMNRAVAVIDEKKAGGGKGRFGRAAPAPIKELGESPVTGKPVRVLNGRYGPYINDGETNANVPKDKKPEDVTLDEALSLLAARAEAGGGKKKKKAPAKKAAAEKKEAAAKKAVAKKAPAKKEAAKKADAADVQGLRRLLATDQSGAVAQQYESTFLAHIEEHGWFCTSAFDPKGARPTFSYSSAFATLTPPSSLSRPRHQVMARCSGRCSETLRRAASLTISMPGAACSLGMTASSAWCIDTCAGVLTRLFGSGVIQAERGRKAFQIVSGSWLELFPWDDDCPQIVRDHLPALYLRTLTTTNSLPQKRER